jgi:hypothetical protein
MFLVQEHKFLKVYSKIQKNLPLFMLFLLDLAIVLHPEFLYLEKKYLPMSDSPVGGTYYPGPGDALLSSSSSLNSLFVYL